MTLSFYSKYYHQREKTKGKKGWGWWNLLSGWMKKSLEKPLKPWRTARRLKFRRFDVSSNWFSIKSNRLPRDDLSLSFKSCISYSLSSEDDDVVDGEEVVDAVSFPFSSCSTSLTLFPAIFNNLSVQPRLRLSNQIDDLLYMCLRLYAMIRSFRLLPQIDIHGEEPFT